MGTDQHSGGLSGLGSAADGDAAGVTITTGARATVRIPVTVADGYRLQGPDEDLSTYRGALEIVLPIIATDDDPGSTRTVRGTLHFQACNSRVCLFAASVPVTLTVAVIPSG